MLAVKNINVLLFFFRYTYDTFCHKKSVLVRDFSTLGEKLGDFRYPPYNRGNISTSRKLMKMTQLPTPPGSLKYLLIFGLGIGFVIALKAVAKKFDLDLPEWL